MCVSKRQRGKLTIQFRRTNSAQESMFYKGVRTYNVLSIEIRRSERLEQFECMLKQHILRVSN